MLVNRHVPLVAYEHNGHVGAGMLPGIFQPRRQMIEGVSPANDTILLHKKLCQFSLLLFIELL